MSYDTNNTPLCSSYSSLITNDNYHSQSNREVVSTITSKSTEHSHLPHSILCIISVSQHDPYECRKKLSIDTSLISYSFLVRLINKLYDFNLNFVIKTKTQVTIKDDFDLDGSILNDMNENIFELTVDRIETHSILDIDDDTSLHNYELITIDKDSMIVTIKSIASRQETLLQKATNWLHDTVQMLSDKCLTKKEFHQMLDASNGRLLNEPLLRQRIYENGCEESIRHIVWCYLFRIFTATMTNEDKAHYREETKNYYDTMKQAWQNRNDSEIKTLENLIGKDVTRTDSAVNFFQSKKNSSSVKLLNILMTYCIYHPEPGYVQGMTDMLAPILYVMRDESLTYVCFRALMHYMGPLFHSNYNAINRRLNLLRKTIRAIDLELWNKIEQSDISNLMFAYRWVLLDCKREFPFKDIFRIFETIWASLPIDKFELNHDLYTDVDEFYTLKMTLNRPMAATYPGLLSPENSSAAEEFPSDQSSVDGADSGFREDHSSSILESNVHHSKLETISLLSNIPLEKWLKDFASIDNDNEYADMFTIFLCIALLEQNRSSIMQITTANVDSDDNLGTYFKRLSRKNDAQQALQLARHYHRQYVVFQMRIKQFSFINT